MVGWSRRTGLRLRAMVAVLLLAGGVYVGLPPSWLSNPVVTARVDSCSLKGVAQHVAVCEGTWTDDRGIRRRGQIAGIDENYRTAAGRQVRARIRDSHTVSVDLEPTLSGWVVRESVALALVAAGVALLVSLVRRRRQAARDEELVRGLAASRSSRDSDL